MEIQQVRNIKESPGLQVTVDNYKIVLLAPRAWIPQREGYALGTVRKQWEAYLVDNKTNKKSVTVHADTDEEALQDLFELHYPYNDGAAIYKAIINSDELEKLLEMEE